MNFISTFDELNKLYEEATEVAKNEVAKEELPVEEAYKADSTKPTDEGLIGDTIRGAVKGFLGEDVEEESTEPRQLICECDKCGALVIKTETDIIVNEESGLVNVEDECQFCEEANGYKIVGVAIPYEAAEEDVTEEDVAEESSEDEVLEEPTEETGEEDLEELFNNSLSLNVPIDVSANGNDVAVGGLAN